MCMSSKMINAVYKKIHKKYSKCHNESGRFGALKSDSTHHFLEMPVPSQGHYGFHSFLVVD